ncbi:ABC transporter permease [Amycolatopsis rhabdoformis]|uniref:ABC transporter permease n=1 Tax=Amycolatopsis rhabdoformis TaxID=1448059 RepID=A0ABZ1IKS8_9PSEU|nr:ABC transporter permease [Amycolatopsis rhabdoformis]WSE34337.1 ABC transporter permease [Amycolatopsis rhabdoformis]
MLTFVARRLVQAVLVVFAAYVVSFVVLFLLPGDSVVSLYAGGDAGTAVDPAQLARLRAEFGFDRPLAVQFVTRLGAAFTGDFGHSLKTGRPVTDLIATALPQTLTLVGVSLVIAVVGGGALALLATYARRPWLRQTLMGLPSIGVSLPTFWVGLMLVQIFSFQLRAFPAIGNAGFASLVLPAITLALPGAAAVSQILAKSLRRTLAEPYVTTALAMGAKPAVIHFRDALRNAAIPALTMSGVLVANMIGGAVVVESVFSRAGLGQLTVSAVLSHDIPVVQGVIVLGAVIFVLVSLAVDLAYPAIDPRLRSLVVKG